jgi:D-lactate dehydrogenase (cytochrome)
LEGNFSAPFGGISVDFAYMDKIIQFNKADMDIVVQPSIGWQDLNEQLAKMGSGLFFPIDPGEQDPEIQRSQHATDCGQAQVRRSAV